MFAVKLATKSSLISVSQVWKYLNFLLEKKIHCMFGQIMVAYYISMYIKSLLCHNFGVDYSCCVF